MTFDEIKEACGEPALMQTRYKVNEDMELAVKTYLPIEEKAKLVQYVVDASLDMNTGCFSPIRLNTYFGLAIMKFYCDVEFGDFDNPAETYDYIETTGILDGVLAAIPEDERNFIQELVDDTVEDMARYNNSFAGIMQAMNGEATNLGDSLDDILSKIKNREGMELLSEIKNVVGGND